MTIFFSFFLHKRDELVSVKLLLTFCLQNGLVPKFVENKFYPKVMLFRPE